MKKPRVQQRTERRISAALRLALVAVLLAAQLALVFLLSTVLKQRAALAYTILELLAFAYAVYIWTKPGTTSYKVGWIFLILFLPVVGLILYWRVSIQASGLEKAAAAAGAGAQTGGEPPECGKAAADHAPMGTAGSLSEQ